MWQMEVKSLREIWSFFGCRQFCALNGGEIYAKYDEIESYVKSRWLSAPSRGENHGKESEVEREHEIRELAKETLAGNKLAEQQLCQCVSDLVIPSLRRMLAWSARNDIEDALQQTLAVILARNARDLSDQERIRAPVSWIFGVAANVCRNIRREARKRSQNEILAGETVGSLPDRRQQEDWERIEQFAKQLPPKLSLIVWMLVRDGEARASIRTALNISDGQYDHAMRTIRARFRAWWSTDVERRQK